MVNAGLTEYDYTVVPLSEIRDRKKIVSILNGISFENDSDLLEIRQILNQDNPLIKRGFTKDEEEF